MRASPMMKWFVLLFTFVFAIGMNSFRNSFQFFMLPMADTFHADRSLISVSVSIFMITTGIVQFFVGFFIDRFSVRKIMALGAVCISASYLVLPYSPNVHVFSAIYGVLGGIGYSCAVGVTTQYFISRWFDTHKGLALAILTNANSAGLLLLSPIWAAAPYHAGWQNTYTILGIVMAAVLLPLLAFGMKHPPHAQAQSVKKSYDWRGFWNVIKQSRLIHILYFGVFTCGFTMGIIDAHLVPMLKDAHVSHVNGMMAAFGAFIIIGGLALRSPRQQKRDAIHLIFHSAAQPDLPAHSHSRNPSQRTLVLRFHPVIRTQLHRRDPADRGVYFRKLSNRINRLAVRHQFLYPSDRRCSQCVCGRFVL